MPDVSLCTEGVWSEMRANIRGFVGRRVRQPADVDDIVQVSLTEPAPNLIRRPFEEKLAVFIGPCYR